MKKIRIYPGVLALIALMTASCTDVVKVDLDEGDKMLVVDAWVNNAPGKQTIRLSTSAPYFSGVNTPIVSGASVGVTDLNNNKTYTFTDAGNGHYEYTPQTADTFCVLNHQYQLNISWQGYNYTSFSTLHRTTTIDSILWRDEPDQPGLTGGLYPYIIARDAEGGKDFYWIKSYQNGKYVSDPSLINVCEDAGGGDGTDGLFFIEPNAYFQVTPSDKPYKENDSCRIEIISISKAGFDFWIQSQKQMTNSQAGLFANTPENVRTNITALNTGAPRAIGWFNMGAVSIRTSYAKKP